VSGFASPYPKWVIDGWTKRSEQVNGAKIAAAFRRNLTAPFPKAEMKAEGGIVHTKTVGARARALRSRVGKVELAD
jgi:hypothetical protein